MVRIDDYSLNLRGHYAGFVTRMLAFVLDVLIIVVSVFVTIAVIDLVLSFLGIQQLIQSIPLFANQEVPAPRATLVSLATAFLVNVLVFDTYQIFFWMVIGKTPGKALVGLRVVSQSGDKLKLRQAIIRVLGYFISGIVFFLGFLNVLIDEDRRAWHDKLARTYVLYEWDARVGRRMLVTLGVRRPELLDEPLPHELEKQRQAVVQELKRRQGDPSI